MTLAPTPVERLARARADLRLGLPVGLRSHGALALVAAVEPVSEHRLRALVETGEAVLAITARRAATLKIRVYDGDTARVALPAGVALRWLHAVADPADDLDHPMKGPFHAVRSGDPVLARLAIRLAKSAHLLPAAVVAPAETLPDGLTCLDAADLADLIDAPRSHAEIVAGRVPLALAEQARVHVFRPEDGTEDHTAVEIGRPPRDAPVLTRLHSACFTGDVVGSLKCDCGPQLHAALEAMGREGAGVLLYLSQEGRGIGLANKMRAYRLQDQGFDTVEANHRLGFEDDERDFRIGADLLRRLGFTSVRLLTNNPAKVDMLRGNGIEVAERVPLRAGRGPENTQYLDTKAAKSGHLL